MAEKSPVVGSPQGGYPVEIFPDRFDEKFLCNHCGKVLRDPVQSYCGHRFCRSCIESVVSNGKQVECQTCIREGVEDKEFSMLAADKVFPDNAVRREMSVMNSKCINPGCDWKGPFKAYEKHIGDCKFKAVACPDCSTLVEMTKLEEHRQTNCPCRKILCKACNSEIAFKDQEDHNKVCPKALIKCDACGKKKISRDKMQYHKDYDCANQKIKCPVGCEPIDRGAFPAHIEKTVGKHVQWLLNQVAQLENTVTPREDISRIAQSITLLQEKVQEQEQRIQSLVDRRAEQGPPVNEQDMTTIKTRCQALELKTGTFEGILTTLHREIERCITALENLERQRATSQENPSERSVEIMPPLTISYDGILIWNVLGWSNLRHEAVSGKTMSIYSPHFFSGRTGYRMCAKLYPNGDGMGKNTHISIFFVVVRGLYDALLSWPFVHRVTFMLLDQNNRDHVIDSFRPDPRSCSFKRPTTDMNIASGCPLFMPLFKLDDANAAYVKDDAMIIKVIVESTDRRLGSTKPDKII